MVTRQVQKLGLANSSKYAELIAVFRTLLGDPIENRCAIDLSRFKLFLCQERFDGTTSDCLIAERAEFHADSHLSILVKRTSIYYPAPADPNGGRPCLCEQDTEELIHRIEDAMQNIISLSVSDEIYLVLQLRSERFQPGIAFLRKTKCY
jgi:hypothetical protein